MNNSIFIILMSASLLALLNFSDSIFNSAFFQFTTDDTKFIQSYPRSIKYLEQIRLEAKNVDINPNLALAIAAIESNFRSDVTNGKTGNRIAIGLFQVKAIACKDTIQKLFNNHPSWRDGYDLFNPANNMRLGMGYLALLQQHYFKEIENKEALEIISIAAYNAGVTRIRKILNNYTGIKYLQPDFSKSLIQDYAPTETKNYLIKVQTAKKLITFTKPTTHQLVELAEYWSERIYIESTNFILQKEYPDYIYKNGNKIEMNYIEFENENIILMPMPLTNI